MNRKTLAILGLQAFIIVILFWLLVFYGKDEYEEAVGEQEEEIETPALLVTGDDAKYGGAATIRLSAASQRQTGIVTTKLQTATHQAEFGSYGSVVNIDGLFELRSRYVAAMSDVTIARAGIPNSAQQLQRLLILNRDNKNVSDQAVAEAEAMHKSNQARLVAAEALARGLHDSLVQQWGEVLSNPNSELIKKLLQQQLVLIQVTLPDNAIAPNKNSQLLISPIGSAAQSIRATYISKSPKVDATIQGKTYFYSAPGDQLRAGMRVSAQLQSQNQVFQGVIVPDTAVVWYANKAWVYQKHATDIFVRQQINTDIEANNAGDNGWFNNGTLREGDEVVVSGAQLLLSEEFKFQITNENDD